MPMLLTDPPPPREVVTKETAHMCNIWIKYALWDKEKAVTQATLDHIEQKEWDEQAA